MNSDSIDDIALHAYSAGIIDGEGTITIAKTGGTQDKPRYALRVTVTSTDQCLPQFLSLNFGGGVRLIASKNPKHKDCWCWEISSRKATKFVSAILPYLRIKQPQAELAISFQSRKHYYGGNEKLNSERVVEQADKILMLSYNKKGGKT
jgi:hypothetical protein